MRNLFRSLDLNDIQIIIAEQVYALYACPKFALVNYINPSRLSFMICFPKNIDSFFYLLYP